MYVINKEGVKLDYTYSSHDRSLCWVLSLKVLILKLEYKLLKPIIYGR